MKKLSVAWGWAVFCCLSLSFAQDPGKPKALNLDGYVKFLQSNTLYGRLDIPMTNSNLLHQRVNLRWYLHPELKLAVSMRNRLFYGEEVKLLPNYAQLIDQNLGLVDMSILWVDKPAVVLHSIFDRAYLNWSHEKWDLTLGRQRINWGLTLVWNPNDLFNAFNFLDFDYEERPGTDAIRIQYQTGLLSHVELAVAPGKTLAESIAAARFLFNVKGYDIQLLSGYMLEDWVVGAGWEGFIKGAGFKGELSYFHALTDDTPGGDAFGLTLMADHQFGKVYTSIATLYNSEGQLSPGIQGGIIGQALSARNLFPSRWAFMGQASWAVHPLFSVNFSTIYATDNQQTILIPNATYSIKENWDLDVFGQLFFDQANAGDWGYNAGGVFFRVKVSY